MGWGEHDYPPGPPPLPRFQECGMHPSRGHTVMCSIGEGVAYHWSVVWDVQEEFRRFVADHRSDREFMRRLRDRLREDKTILDRLGEL